MSPTRQRRLDELQARIRLCRQCLNAGYDIYPRPIFSGGLSSRIMLIGQAPGITEKEAGRPFNAGSGTRLFQWLAQAGIDEAWYRETQYLTAVTKCYPGRAISGNGDRVPSRTEQELCRPFLNAEIALVNPQLILPVGRLAIGLFFPSNQPLNEIIGTEKLVDGRWMVPLPHSSGASRWHQTPENRQHIQEAIQLIAKRFQEIKF
jgi:uracil-DNA glycosylase